MGACVYKDFSPPNSSYWNLLYALMAQGADILRYFQYKSAPYVMGACVYKHIFTTLILYTNLFYVCTYIYTNLPYLS